MTVPEVSSRLPTFMPPVPPPRLLIQDETDREDLPQDPALSEWFSSP